MKFWAAQLIMGIGYLHDKMNIAHRDIKLENTLIDEDGYIVIIDYGMAKKIDGSSIAETFVGTTEYIAPEIWLEQKAISGKGYGKEVDWWSIGIMLYEMLIGVTPFYAKTKRAMENKIKYNELRFPDKKRYRIDYSEEFVEFIRALL